MSEIKVTKDFDIGQFLYEARKTKGFSRASVAYIAGLNQTSVLNYECFGAQPRFTAVAAMLSCLGYDVIIRRKK